MYQNIKDTIETQYSKSIMWKEFQATMLRLHTQAPFFLK